MRGEKKKEKVGMRRKTGAGKRRRKMRVEEEKEKGEENPIWMQMREVGK